jgi:ribosome biogenesis GTPase
VAQGRAGDAGGSRLASLRRLLGAGERPGESREDKELGIQ